MKWRGKKRCCLQENSGYLHDICLVSNEGDPDWEKASASTYTHTGGLRGPNLLWEAQTITTGSNNSLCSCLPFCTKLMCKWEWCNFDAQARHHTDYWNKRHGIKHLKLESFSWQSDLLLLQQQKKTGINKNWGFLFLLIETVFCRLFFHQHWETAVPEKPQRKWKNTVFVSTLLNNTKKRFLIWFSEQWDNFCLHRSKLSQITAEKPFSCQIVWCDALWKLDWVQVNISVSVKITTCLK